MNKIARRVFAALAIASVLLMAGLVWFALNKVYALRQHIERIQVFAKENDIVLERTENILNNKKTFEIKSNSDTNLAFRVVAEFYNPHNDDKNLLGLYFENLSFLEKIYDCFLEKDGDVITFSAKIEGKCYLVEKGTGDNYDSEGNKHEICMRGIGLSAEKEPHFEFNENGTRKRVFVPTDVNQFTDVKFYMRKCIGSALKSIVPEIDMEKVTINVQFYRETEVDYTKFVQEDFLYLKEKLEAAKNFGKSTILLFLFYLFAMLSFIISFRKVSSGVFAGIAFFISVYVMNGTVVGIFFVLAVVVILDAFLSSTSIEKRFLTVVAYIVFVMILGVSITSSDCIENIFFRGIEFYFDSASGFIKYIVSAIDILMCAMFLDGIRHVIRAFNMNPFTEFAKEIVHIELASSFLPCLSKIEERLSKLKNSIFFSPKYKISISGELSENEYKIVKDGKVYASKTLTSDELTDTDLDILVGLAILAKHS